MSDTMCSRCNEKPAAICISCLTDCTESLKQQPPAGEFTKRIRLNLKGGTLFRGNWPQFNFKKMMKPDVLEVCDRLDRTEAINKDLLTALEGFIFIPDCGGMFCIDEEGCWPPLKACEHVGYCKWAYGQMQIFKAAIAKAKIEEPK